MTYELWSPSHAGTWRRVGAYSDEGEAREVAAGERGPWRIWRREGRGMRLLADAADPLPERHVDARDVVIAADRARVPIPARRSQTGS